MGFAEVIHVSTEELEICDSCNQEGRLIKGQFITDSSGQPVMWFCFNCVNKVLN
jgi:hypothetical protein